MDSIRFVVVAALAGLCDILRKYPAANKVVKHLTDAQAELLTAQEDKPGSLTVHGITFNNAAGLTWTEIDILLGTKNAIEKIPAIKALRARKADKITGVAYGLKEAKEEVERFLGDNGYGQYSPHNGQWSEARGIWISPAEWMK